jgi:hypothetical protein
VAIVTDPIIHLSPAHTLNLAADRWRLQGLRVSISGISGSGKTNLGAVFYEELYSLRAHGYQVPFVVIDPRNDYRSLKELGAGVKVVSSRAGDIHMDYPGDGWLNATMEALAAGCNLIVDLKPLFSTSEKRVAYTQILTSLLRYQEDAREPILLGVEEAHLFCPSKRQQDVPALQVTVDTLRMGRASGINMIIASQRPGDLEGDARSQCNLHFIGVLESPLDYEAVKHQLFVPADMGQASRARAPRGLESAEVLKTPQLRDLMALKTGQFYVRFGTKLNLIDIRKRRTTHIGATPEIKVKQPRLFDNGKGGG